MAVLGTLIMAAVLTHVSLPRASVGHPRADRRALLLILGMQVIALGLCALAYGVYFMGERDAWFNRMRARFRLEHGLLLGGTVIADWHHPRRRWWWGSGSTVASAAWPSRSSRC